MSQENEVGAESYVRQSIEAALIRQCLVPMPVSDSSSRHVPTTGKLVDVPQGLSREGELVTFPRYIADKVAPGATQPKDDPPATELLVKRTLESRLFELGRKSFEHTTKVLYARAHNLVAGDDLATVEFVQKALTSVFSPPSAETELLSLAAPFMLAGERLIAFFARTNVSASELRTLSRSEIAQRILRREREIEDEKREAEERKARCSKPQPEADSRDAYLNRMRLVAAQG